ncbi:uncharacterized protein [Linepithema humile]|uniref:uncharacterized protein n=1 Tax=Linepithema humile TaxID=83485 RepID=UPI00351F4A18
MDRASLENLSPEELRQQVTKYRLSPNAETREAYTEALVQHFERFRAALEEGPATDSGAQPIEMLPSATLRPARIGSTSASASEAQGSTQPPWDALARCLTSLTSQMQRQESLLERVVRQLNHSPAGPANLESSTAPPSSGSGALSPRPSSVGTANLGHAVSILATQIPEFGGAVTENPQVWLTRVDQVARVHNVPDDVKLLATSSKLIKVARKWYDLSTGSIIESWTAFSQALTSRFKRTAPYHVTLQRIEARKWNSAKEAFQEYAMDRIALMHGMQLPMQEKIQLLLSGINSPAVRAAAAAMDVHSMDEFLDRMERVVNANPDQERKSAPTKNFKTETSSGGEKAASSAKQKLFCVYCKTPGHLRKDCLKIRKRETQPPATPTSAVAAVQQDTENTVALVQHHCKRITFGHDPIIISRINNVKSDVTALIDTGSPVSFARADLLSGGYGLRIQEVNQAPALTAINNSLIKITGAINTEIVFAQHPERTFIISLFVLDTRSLATQIIIGRDFLNNHSLFAIYRPSRSKAQSSDADISSTFPEELLKVHACYEPQRGDEYLKELAKEMDPVEGIKLINLFKEIAELKVSRVEDDYCVRVNIKDTSTYAYAPRKFAYSERIQLRNITDDLIARDMKDGFHQISVHPSDTKYFSFATPDGQFEYTKLPFGFADSPAEFQKRIVQILQPLIRTDKLIVYIDDVLIATDTVDSNLQVLKQTLVEFKNPECRQAYDALKRFLTSYPILAIYNPAKETQLHTDASAHGLGAILLQKQEEGQWSPIAYYSQTTNQAESRYHSFELEMLAIVRAVERFHIYLYGITFTIVTDCNALVYAVSKANLNPRIARWTLALQNYSFKITHRPGSRMAHVDALSRQTMYVSTLPLERILEFQQLQDPTLKQIALDLEYRDNKKFKLIEELVYRKGDDRDRFAVPESMVNAILKTYHDELAHCGYEKTVQGIQQTYWFPALRKRVRDYIYNCIVCLSADASTHRLEGELQIEEAPNEPFTIIHVDHFGPLQTTADGYKHVLITIDAFTRFTSLFPVKSTSSKEVCIHLSTLFNFFGIPEEVVTDRGSAFTSAEFSNFLAERRIKLRKVAVASPWANGKVERVNRFIKSSLAKLVKLPDEWKEKLQTLQYVINNTFHTALRCSPSKILFGFDQRGHIDKQLRNELEKQANDSLSFDQQRDNTREVAVRTNERLKEYNKLYYDRQHKKPTVYTEGQYVLIRDLHQKVGINNKLKSNYKGPYVVKKILNKNRYVVTDIPGFNITQRPYNSILSPDKMKPWVKPLNDGLVRFSCTGAALGLL